MITAKPIRQIILVQLEAFTAHAVHSGYADNLKDNLIVRDANGLPAIPGSSIAGVLNHLYQESYGKQEAEMLFGFANQQDSQISHLQVDWALVHDSNNRPVEGLLPQVKDDQVLSWLAQDYPLSRDRVRLNERGVALEKAKFDVSLLPKGVRYSFLMQLHSDTVENAQARGDKLLALLKLAKFRLGHGTRNGYGAFKVSQVNSKTWDLTKAEQSTEYCHFSRTRFAARDLPLLEITPQINTDALTLELTLQAENGWRIGGGKHSLLPGSGDQQQAQIMPQSEQIVQWHNDSASMSERYIVIPGSAIKGALAHRVAFHARRRAGIFAQQDTGFDHLSCPEVKALFGCVDEQDEGQAGLIIIDDLMFEPSNNYIQQLMHNKIDHFTGGVINGALFSEEMLWQTEWKLVITLLSTSSVNAQQLQPLFDALDDLSRGWLAIGAGSSRGLGMMKCSKWECSDESYLNNIALSQPELADFMSLKEEPSHA